MVVKGVKYVLLFLVPALIDQFLIAYPAIAQLSLGGLLVMLANFLKVRVGLKLL